MNENDLWKDDPNESKLQKIIRLVTFNWKFRNAMIGENERGLDSFYANMSLVEKKADGSVVVQNKAGIQYVISGDGSKKRMTIKDKFIK